MMSAFNCFANANKLKVEITINIVDLTVLIVKN